MIVIEDWDRKGGLFVATQKKGKRKDANKRAETSEAHQIDLSSWFISSFSFWSSVKTGTAPTWSSYCKVDDERVCKRLLFRLLTLGAIFVP